MKKKILIVIADIGNGHMSAAKALKTAFESKYKDQFQIKIIDLYKEADVEPFNSADISYEFLSNNRGYEQVSNLVWRFTNTYIGYQMYKGYFLGLILNASREIIKRETPDLVISAYPLTCTIMNQLKKEGFQFKYSVIITDLMTMHRSWADDQADLIVSPTSDAVSHLVNYGVNINKILYPYFPLKPELSLFRTKEEVYKELRLDISKPIILLTGGGLGTKAIKQAILKLSKREDLHLVVIAGKLMDFKNELEEEFKDKENIRILGFVNNMHDYLNACEIVIGKPGATTVMEVELFGKKAIFTRFIGVHDSGNVEYALRDPRIKYVGDDWSKLDEYVKDLLSFEEIKKSKIPKRVFNESETIVEEITKVFNT